MALDTFSHFTYAQTSIPDSLYYYYIDSTMLTSSYFAIPPVDAVVSVVSMPYIKGLSTRDVTYDTKRFPLSGYSDSTDPLTDVPLKRIEGHSSSEWRYQLGTFNKYPTKNLTSTFSWRNESKLFEYPFSYGIISDGISTPIEVKYHQCATNQVWTCSTLNPTGAYNLYVKDYQNDPNGLLFGQSNISSGMLPTVSSAYANYMSQNKAQNQVAKLNGVGSIIQGGITGALVGGVWGAVGGVVANSTNILNTMAQEKDLSRTPNNLKSQGGDTVYDLLMSNTTGVSINGELNHYRMQQPESVMERVGWFFHMYGYAQNRVMMPNVTSRSRYNYIKGDMNIIGDMDNDVIQQLKEIHSKGVTYWHVDDILNYSLDNTEV